MSNLWQRATAFRRPDEQQESPQAFRTNTVCAAHGTAGVAHALWRAGLPVPEEVRKRLREDALDAADTLPPGSPSARPASDGNWPARDTCGRGRRHDPRCAGQKLTIYRNVPGLSL
ncbi:hypothetical protein [Kitasatospora purpeofusca]|uniref:hypothetical protein n=1 Tax=Kitasatospora purpeofusca TaxID=67352 RepID=UPI003820405C